MVESLNRQILDHGYLMGAEVLFHTNVSVKERGRDRNTLLQRAQGEYCCYVDDDDVIALNYVDVIMRAIYQNPDCDVFGILGVVTSLATNESKVFELSLRHPRIFSLPNDELQDGIFKRYVSHLNPIKTEIARKIGFPNDMINEDNGYTERLKTYCNDHSLKEVMISEPLYYYFNRFHITSNVVIT